MTSIALPDVGFVVSRPKLVDSVSVSRVGARAFAFVEYADPFWQIEMRTKPLRAAELALVEAFREQTRHGLRTVSYKPTHMCVPRAFWGNAEASELASVGEVIGITNAHELSVNSVDDGLVLSPGDLIGLEDGDYRSLHRIVTGGAAETNVINVTVEPFIPSYITIGAAARFKNPELNCRVLPGSFDIPDMKFPSASFTLVEVPL